MRPTYKMAVLTTCLSFALFLGIGTTAVAGESRTITMTGTGTVSAPPNRVKVTASVECDGKTAAAALEKNAQIMSSVRSIADELGKGARTVSTSEFTLVPVRYNQGIDGPIIGYRVTNSVSVTSTDTTQTGTVIDALVKAGANRIDEIAFQFTGGQALQTRARNQAVKDATEKAVTYAKAAGVSLGPIQNIREGQDNEPNIEGLAADFVVGTDRHGTKISSANPQVEVTVTITWAIQ